MILKLLRLILEIIRAIVQRKRPPKPGPMTVRPIEETPMGLRYEAHLPPMPTGTDISAQKLTVSHSGTSEDIELGVDDTTAQFVVPQDVDVTLSLVYADDATPPNVSEPSVQTFHSNDTIAPDAPGAFGEITLLGEEP